MLHTLWAERDEWDMDSVSRHENDICDRSLYLLHVIFCHLRNCIVISFILSISHVVNGTKESFLWIQMANHFCVSFLFHTNLRWLKTSGQKWYHPISLRVRLHDWPISLYWKTFGEKKNQRKSPETQSFDWKFTLTGFMDGEENVWYVKKESRSGSVHTGMRNEIFVCARHTAPTIGSQECLLPNMLTCKREKNEFNK